MKRYSEYKDSGVKWIGEIPGHWKKNKMMRLFSHIGSGTTPKGDQYYTDESNGIPWINSGDLNYGFLTKCNKYITEKALNDISTLKIYPINTLLIAMYGASIGKYAISHIEGCTNQACCALYGIKDELNLTYASYLMGPCKQKWIEESFGGTQPNISAEKIKQTWLPIPPLPEQEAIVTYLDSKVAKIDEYISIAEKKIAALEELKQTIIAEAVTRGIHKDVPMKDSGVKWIGMIPEHWKVSKIRSFLKLSSEKTDEPNATLLSLSQYTGVKLKSECERTGMFEAENTIGYNVVHKGQFVMNIMLAWNGSYSVSKYDGVISPAYCVFDFIADCNKDYYDFLLRLKSYSGAFKTLSKGLIDSRLRLYPNYFKTFPILIPPLNEQNEIVTYLDSKLASINQLCQAERSQIEKLKEYKQRLISDVVTGKVKVTND